MVDKPRVLVNDTVHGDHEPHQSDLCHEACSFAGQEFYVADVDSIDTDDGRCTCYYLDGAGDLAFFEDELDVISLTF